MPLGTGRFLADLLNLNLAHPHGVQGHLVALRRHSGAAVRNDPDGCLRQECLDQQGVGDHADVRAEAHQRDFQLVQLRQQGQLLRQLLRAAAIFGCSSQPVVPLTQWTTGRFRPSWVSR